MMLLYNHIAPRFSKLELEMVQHIPPGGNWQDIPESVPSQRLAQIRRNGGGRTTYYGRLRWNKPSYTISTYFNRMGNGCHIHPEQNRLISIREGARLQSFPDSYRFHGSKASIYKQIGNAVPPLLGFVIASSLRHRIRSPYFVDLFAGAGGLSEGFRMGGLTPVAGIEIDESFFQTYKKNLGSTDGNGFVCGNVCEARNQKKIVDESSSFDVDVIAGGPPCQGFSLAGWFNPSDLRNQLFKEFVSMVAHLSPKIFILENVLGMLSMDKGGFVRKMISEFESIGYYVSMPWKLNAADYGVPQLRKRVFLVGSSQRSEFLPPSPIFDEEHYATVKDAIFGLPPLEPGDGEDSIEYNLEAHSNYQRFLMGEIDAESFIQIQSTKLIVKN